MNDKKWVVSQKLSTKSANLDKIINILLENRQITDKKEFFSPTSPYDIPLKMFGISEKQMEKAISRINQALLNKEEVIIYGDYDADGICATAILWESLFAIGLKVMPFIPNRFNDGYGINPSSLEKIKINNPKLSLIITVDNGIVAHKAMESARKLGIDVIITDHHTRDAKVPKCIAAIHTTQISGSGVAWVFSREILNGRAKININETLELAAIGTVSDQLPLVGVNRSIVKHGIDCLRKSKRLGIKKMLEDSSIDISKVGTYEIGFVISPRINAMGRLADGIDSLRLLCTKSAVRARKLSKIVTDTNLKRQKVVEEVLIAANSNASLLTSRGVICIIDENYHEGIIGLAASKLVDTFSRPAIVLSKGAKLSKGSARSISGIHITEILRQLSELLVEMGGHELAAGFTIENKNIDEFRLKLEDLTRDLITDEIKAKTIKIDLEIPFSSISWDLASKIKEFEPTGTGNPQPIFVTNSANVKDKKYLGKDRKHIKLKLEKGGQFIEGVLFSCGEILDEIPNEVNLVYNLEINCWNGVDNLQLKIKDIRWKKSTKS